MYMPVLAVGSTDIGNQGPNNGWGSQRSAQQWVGLTQRRANNSGAHTEEGLTGWGSHRGLNLNYTHKLHV